MGTFAIVGDAPALDLAAGIVERKEDVFIETLFSQPRIETLDIGVLNRFARRDKLQFHPMLVRPVIEDPAAEFRPVVGLNHQRQTALVAEPL